MFLAWPFALSTYLSGNTFPILREISADNGVSVSGYRKHSLSLSGAVAAFFTGFIMMSIPLQVFGITLIAFYLIGSKVKYPRSVTCHSQRITYTMAGHQSWEVRESQV